VKGLSFVLVGIASVIFLALEAPLGADLTPDQAKKAQKLFGLLSAPQLAVRQKVVEELVKMGPDVLPLIKKTLEETENAEVRRHCQMVIDGIARQQKDPAQPVPRQREKPEELRLNRRWPRGDVATLRKMKPEDVVKMQIFRIGDLNDLTRNRNVRHHTAPPFGIESKEEVAALLAIIRRAKPAGRPRPGSTYVPAPPDRVLVVQPVKSQPFEFLYSQMFHEPFAGLGSRELKEAFYLLSGGPLRVSVIHLQDGKVREALHKSVGRGMRAGQRMTCRLKLTAEHGLSLAVKLREKGETLMEETQPMYYGQARVFASKGPGTYIVLLNRP